MTPGPDHRLWPHIPINGAILMTTNKSESNDHGSPPKGKGNQSILNKICYLLNKYNLYQHNTTFEYNISLQHCFATFLH